MSWTGTTPVWRHSRQAHPGARDAPTLACSSAGGGLRIAVLGNEALVTAEAGRRVALSSGGKVVLVLDGGLDADKFAALKGAQPDVLLLVGGTDGGNSETLVRDADFLSRAPWTGPVVVAGDVEARSAVEARFEISQTPVVFADNVVPAHRGPRARVGAPRDPGGLPGPRDRRQAPQSACGRLRTALRRDGARRDPRRRAHRRRAAGCRAGSDRSRRGCRGRRHRWRDDRCALGRGARPRGGGALPRGGRDHPGHSHRGG